MELLERKCKPCEKGTLPLNITEIDTYMKNLSDNWVIVDGKMIKCDFIFDNYLQTLAFVNKAGLISENEGHHPVMHVYFSKISIELWTHAIGGLSENDFILAAKIDEEYKNK